MTELKKIIESYERGLIVAAEAADCVVGTATRENARETVEALESYSVLYGAVGKRVAEYAAMTDEQRAGGFVLRSWCGPWTEEIKKKLEESDRERKERYARGAGALREVWPPPG